MPTLKSQLVNYCRFNKALSPLPFLLCFLLCYLSPLTHISVITLSFFFAFRRRPPSTAFTVFVSPADFRLQLPYLTLLHRSDLPNFGRLTLTSSQEGDLVAKTKWPNKNMVLQKILFDTNKRMSKAEEVKFHIKVVINREKNKVLFAEAGSDFTDVLLSFLLLPLGTIVKVLEQHYGEKTPAIGSLNTLYKSVANLDSIHFKRESFKQDMLIPNLYRENRSCELKLNINCTHPTSCSSEKSYAGVFTKSSASFIISDDLKVLPSVAGSIIETLSTLSIAMADMDGVETRNVTFGLNEIMGLLKESLISRNPLTALVFPGSRMILEREGHISVNQIDQTVASKNPKKMIVKAMMQKSTNKFLYAQVDKHFINFLFGTLTIPLGKVESYLDSNSGVTTMDNLHGSIPGLNSNHLMTRGAYNALFCQELISYYLYVNEYIPLNFDPNRHQRHVKGSRMYMVSDDLTVSPLGVTSGLSVINELKISLSDVDELQLQVGLEEGLSILKAALTSTTALTDSLFEPMKKKVPKQEN